ncbi:MULTISPECIES: phospholipase D-like domain-containing protein [Deferrisoma]
MAAGPDVEGNPLRDALLAAFARARRHVWVVSPYFLPDEALLQMLAVQARAGIEVTIVVPERSNHRLADWARERPLQILRDAGARILGYGRSMIHAKLVVVDESFGLFGSANLDMRSLYLNFEVGLALYTPEDVGALRRIAAEYASASGPLAFPHRRGNVGELLVDLAELLAPLL